MAEQSGVSPLAVKSHLVSIVQQFERTHFKKLGIPTVTLESTVHKEPPTEKQIMKVKTFIEMLS